jgi:hypothetical protein
MNQLIEALNKDFNSGNTGIEFSFVPNENNADQGEIWIMRGPSKSDPDKKRTGKNYQPIRLAVDTAMLEGHAGPQAVLNLRGKVITSEMEYKHGTVDVDERVSGFDSKDWHKRSAFDVARRIIAESLGEVEGDRHRRDFGSRFTYLTDPYGSLGTSLSFKQMRQLGDNRINAVANTVSIRSPFAANDKDFGSHLQSVARRTGFISGTAGIISASDTPRSSVSMAPIKDLEPLHGTVMQTTHFGYAAARKNPVTGQYEGPIDTGRFMSSDGRSYTVGYNSTDSDKVFGKESKRASLTQRLQYLPDPAENKTKIERYQTGGRERMNEIVVIARPGDKVGQGGSIASFSMLGLNVYDHETQKQAALPKGFRLNSVEFLGRAQGGGFSQAGGAIARDNDVAAAGSSDGRKIRVDRTGMEGIEIGKKNRAKIALDAKGNIITVKDSAGKDVMEDAPEYRISFGYDSDTIRMVSDFGITLHTRDAHGKIIRSEKYDQGRQAELEEIFSPEVMTAMQGGSWRKGVTKRQKELHGKFVGITQAITEQIQKQNLGVAVSLDSNQGGSTSGRTTLRWDQRRKIDIGAEKGGSMKETVHGNYLPENPETGGEVDRFMPVVRDTLARMVHGDRKLERMVYQTDRRGNFVLNNTAGITDPADLKKLAEEIDPATGLYKNRVVRDLSGAQLEDLQGRARKEYDRRRKAAIAQQNVASDMSKAAIGEKVEVVGGTYAGRSAYVEHQGKRAVTAIDPVTKKPVTSFVDDADYATVRIMKTQPKMEMRPVPDRIDTNRKSPTYGKMIPVLDKKGNQVMRMTPTGDVEEVFDTYESYHIGAASSGSADVQRVVDPEIAKRIHKSRNALDLLDDIGSDGNAFGRWMQNRQVLPQESIGSEFLERFVGPVSKLMSIGEQKSDELFQLESLVGMFHTEDSEFARARQIIRDAFGHDDADSVNIWTAAEKNPTLLRDTMRKVLDVTPRVFARGEHPEYRLRGNAAYERPGLYQPPQKEHVDQVTGAVTMVPGEWSEPKNTLDYSQEGRISVVRSTLGFSAEYTGLGRMTSEMMRMIHKNMPELHEDIASHQAGRAHLIHALTPDLAKEKVDLGVGDLSIPSGQHMDDDERYEEVMQSWKALQKARGVTNAAALVLPALPGEDRGYEVANPDVYVGQERSAIGRAFINLLEKSVGGSYKNEEVIEAREIYEAERETFFQQQETVKNALSLSTGLITGFSRYVSDDNVADNEIVIGDDTVSLLAEQASRMAEKNVSKEDIIAAINSKEGMYGFAPRMPEVTEYMLPFRFRYDKDNKSLPRVNKYFSLTYMGDNDADPLMMAIMGAFSPDKDGKMTYSNFRQVKEAHEKLPAGYEIAMARIRSGYDPDLFASEFRSARASAQKMLDYEIDNNLLVRRDEQGRNDDSVQRRIAAARSSGGAEYTDMINRYTMEGLIRGRSIKDSSGNVIKHSDGTDLNINPMIVKTATRYNPATKKIEGGKGQNIEADIQEDLAKGVPDRASKIITDITKHEISGERMAEFKKEEEQIYKGMGIFTYLKSMTSFFDNKHFEMVERALGPQMGIDMADYAQSKTKASGDDRQFTSPAALAREGIIMQYQEAIDMVRSTREMEESSKNFFTADVVDYFKRGDDMRRTAVLAMVDSGNMQAHTIAAMLGDDESRVAQIFQGVKKYRAGRYSPAGSKEFSDANDALKDINILAQQSTMSMWNRAMRGTVLINTQDRLNSGWYEENKTVEQRQEIQRAYGEFMALTYGDPKTGKREKIDVVKEAMEMGSLRRMRATEIAIASAKQGFMASVLANQNFDVSTPLHKLEESLRRSLGGKNIRGLSMKPGPADAREKEGQSVVNVAGITSDPRKGDYVGINSSYKLNFDGSQKQTVTDKILQMLGVLKGVGQDFTAEELRRLPISPSQINYLADPSGDEKAMAKQGFKPLEGEGTLHSSGVGLINQIISGMYKAVGGETLGGEGSGDLGRGMFKVINSAFERGTHLEGEVFREIERRGLDPVKELGFRTKGHVYSEYFNVKKGASGYEGAGTISYEPDLLVPQIDSSTGAITGWQVKDIKTTSTKAKSGFGTPDDWYIKEEGEWDGNPDTLPGGYVTQQAFYVQAMNEFAANVKEHIVGAGLNKDSSGKDISVGQYLEGVAGGVIAAPSGNRKMVEDLAGQYKGIHSWFTSADNKLSPDAARNMVESIINTGVTAGGLRFNVTMKAADGSRVMKKDASGNIELLDYDTIYGPSSGFAKLRAMTGGVGGPNPLDASSLAAGRNLTTKLRKAASENRFMKTIRNLPQYIAATSEAAKRWSEQRENLFKEIKRNPGGIKGSSKSVSDQDAGLLARELAGTMPYVRSLEKDRKNKKGGFITEKGMVAVESEFAKRGILNVNSKDGKELSNITGLSYSDPKELMEGRMEFRKLIASAARGINQKGDISDKEYQERASLIARFMEGTDREKALIEMRSKNMLADSDLAAFKTAGGGFTTTGSASLVESASDTARQLYQVLESKYGASRGAMVSQGRVVVDPFRMHETNLKGEDKRIQGDFFGKAIELGKALISRKATDLGSLLGFVDANRNNGSLAQVVDSAGNPISADGGRVVRNTLENIMGEFRDHAAKGGTERMTREDYTSIVIPETNSFSPTAGSAVAGHVERSKGWMSKALEDINPELAERIKNAPATHLPKLYQEAFEAIGSHDEYYARVGRNTTSGAPTRDYKEIVGQFNQAVQALGNQEVVDYFGGLNLTGAMNPNNYIPPQMDDRGGVVLRSEPIAPTPAGGSPPPAAPPPSASSAPTPSGSSPAAPAASAAAPAGGSAPGAKAPKGPRIVDSKGVIDLNQLNAQLPDVHDALSIEERRIIEKNKQHNSKAGGPKLTKKERAIHDDVTARIGAARKASASAAPGFPSPGPSAAPAAGGAAPGGTTASSPASTPPASAAPTSGAPASATPSSGATVHSAPGSSGPGGGTPTTPGVGSIAAGGSWSNGVPAFNLQSPSIVLDYLEKFTKTTTTDPSTGVVNSSYSRGVDDVWIAKAVEAGQIGEREKNLLLSLSGVFSAMATPGSDVKAEDLTSARKSLLALAVEVQGMSGSGWDTDKGNVHSSIQRVLSLLQSDGVANTRSGKRMASAAAAAGIVATASGAGASAAAAVTGGAAAPSAPKGASATYVDITTTEKEMEQAARWFKHTVGSDPKINTDSVYSGLLRSITNKDGILRYNQEVLGDPKARLKLANRVGWDTARGASIVNDGDSYSRIAKSLSTERNKIQNEIKETENLISSIESAYTKDGRKFAEDPQAMEMLNTLKVAKANAEASLGVGGVIGGLEHEIAMTRAVEVTNARSQNLSFANTIEGVRADMKSGAISNPGGMTDDQFIFEEAQTRRAAGKSGAGYTADQRQESINREYAKAKKQLETGNVDIKEFFGEIRDFTQELKKSTKGWVATLSDEGKKATMAFVSAVESATDAIEEFAGLDQAKRNDPVAARQTFQKLLEARKNLDGQMTKIEQDPSLDSKQRAELLAQTEHARDYIDDILTRRGSTGVLDAAEKDMGKKAVKDALAEQGLSIDDESRQRNSGKWPGFNLMGAHAAYQIFMAAKTGFNPMIESAQMFEQARMGSNAILSSVGQGGARSETAAGRGEEAKKSWQYRRGRESGRLGDLLSGSHDSGAVSVLSDLIDPVRGAGVALVPLYETINTWGAGNRASRDSSGRPTGLLGRMDARGFAMRDAASKAAEAGFASSRKGALGKAEEMMLSAGNSLSGIAGGLISSIANNPGGAVVIGGMVASALASGVANYSAAANDQRGLALVNQIARYQGSDAAFNASPWSYMAAGLNRPGEYFTRTYGRAAEAAFQMGGGDNLLTGAETRAYLEYSSLAGEWRNYSKALGVDSGSQLEAQSLALMIGGGVRRNDDSYEGMERRLIRAQSTGEGASNAVSMAQQMAAAMGERSFKSAERYLQNLQVDYQDPEVRKRVGSLQKDVDDAQAKYDSAVEASKMRMQSGGIGNGGGYGGYIADAIITRDAQTALREAKDRLAAETQKPEWDIAKSAIFTSNFEKVGNPQDMDKAAFQSGIAAEGEIRKRSEDIIAKAAQDGIEFDSRQGELIASSLAGNKLFEMSLRGMNVGQAGYNAIMAKVGPMDSFTFNGQTFYGSTGNQREVSAQIASYGESIRGMRAQSGLSYESRVDSYVGGVQVIRDDGGRAVGLDRSSMSYNTYENFSKDALQRATEMYGIGEMKAFKNPLEAAKALGLTPKKAMVGSPDARNRDPRTGDFFDMREMEYLDEYQKEAVSDLQQQVGLLQVQSDLAGINLGDFSEDLDSLYKDSKTGERVKNPVTFQNLATRIQMTAGGGIIEKRANAMGFSNGLINDISKGSVTGLPLDFIAKLGSGDARTLTEALLYRMDDLNKATGGEFGRFVGENGIAPLVDVSTGAGIFERSMVGMKNPFTGSLTTLQSQITPEMVGASMDPMRKQLFGKSGAAYAGNNAAMAGYKYTNPDTGKTEVIGGVAGLNLRSNQLNYETQMASIAISREQLEYNRNKQLTWDFPIAATQNEIARAQALGGIVHSDWMKQNGIGPLDYSGGTVKIDGMNEAVTYEGGQIGLAMFNLGMSKIEAKRGYEQGMARMGWQVADMTREIDRSRIRGGWQRDDFALQADQMQFARSKQMYDFGYQSREMGITRQQYREDFAFQERQRQLQFGWQMEDADINIRRSTGFERKQLIKQKERETISFNMESEQVARQNTRQEEAFKREEEKFNKEIEHYKKSLEFEDEQFKRQQKRFDQQREWEEEDFSIKMGRAGEEAAWAAEAYQRQLAKFAVEEDQLLKQKANEEEMAKWRQAQHERDMIDAEKMYELSKKSLENSAKSVEEQKKIQDDLVILNQRQQDAVNAVTNAFAKVDWVGTAAAIKELLETLRKLGIIKDAPKENKTNGKNDLEGEKAQFKGGFVNKGTSYVVGEVGQEILNIGIDGKPMILPNSAIPKDRSMSRVGAGNEVVHIHVIMDSEEIATYTADKANSRAVANRRRSFNG